MLCKQGMPGYCRWRRRIPIDNEKTDFNRNVMKHLLCIVLVLVSLHVWALKPKRDYDATPEKYGLIYKDLKVVTEDGLRIKCWFFPAQDSVPQADFYKAWEHPLSRPYQLKYDSPRPTIIVCNADAGNMMYLIQFARGLTAFGYNVVTFDWRGFGESDNWETNEDDLVYPEFLLDYDAVLAAVCQQAEVDSSRIGLYGFSSGAYLSFATFYRHPGLKAYAGRGLITDFESALDCLSRIDPDRKLLIPANYPEELMPVTIADQIDRPCFLIVGELDDRTQVSMSVAIFNRLKGEKQLWVVDKATHGGATGPDFINLPRFISQLRNFFDLNL